VTPTSFHPTQGTWADTLDSCAGESFVAKDEKKEEKNEGIKEERQEGWTKGEKEERQEGIY
jgi:hypothetical protein